MSNNPADLKYTKSHEWVRTLANGNVEVGITYHAQGALGDLVFVEVPEKGKSVKPGDAFAVAVPLSLGVGRIACLLGGCCYGTPSDVAWHVHLAGADRHPVQLYEALLDFALAGLIYAARNQSRPAGELFKLSLIGYALIRVVLDPFRGDARVWLGPVSAVQLVCLAAIAVLWLAMQRSERTAHVAS